MRSATLRSPSCRQPPRSRSLNCLRTVKSTCATPNAYGQFFPKERPGLAHYCKQGSSHSTASKLASCGSVPPLRYGVRGLQGGINHASVGLRSNFIFGHNGLHLAKVKCAVDTVTCDVFFNPSKLLSKRSAILVVLLYVAHS